MQNGVLAGYPIVDIKATLFDGSYHDVDSSEMAFKIAGSIALKAAKEKCDPVLLEPIMKVEVTVPEEYMGDIIGDINSRRGRVEGMEPVGIPGHPGLCPPGGNVRVCDQPALPYPRPRHLHHAV